MVLSLACGCSILYALEKMTLSISCPLKHTLCGILNTCISELIDFSRGLSVLSLHSGGEFPYTMHSERKMERWCNNMSILVRCSGLTV